MTSQNLTKKQKTAVVDFISSLFSCPEAKRNGFALLGKDLEGLLKNGNAPSYVALRSLEFSDNHSHYELHECLTSPDQKFDRNSKEYRIGDVAINISGCLTNHGATQVTGFDRLFHLSNSVLTTTALVYMDERLSVQTLEIKDHGCLWKSTYQVPLQLSSSRVSEGHLHWEVTLIKPQETVEDEGESFEDMKRVMETGELDPRVYRICESIRGLK
ncbi:hypothetical protein ColTof3_08527 [Colletotrichum tofieldiae]|nr:hypothetical protein ColTof3_08527 [Colletotrichum tofieldiae]